jgi:hypothetical protein
MGRALRLSEGEVFDVPLRRGGWCTGLLARKSNDGICVGYFYGPRLTESSRADDLMVPEPEAALLIARFGISAFVSGAWAIRGRAQNWNRTKWRPLEFIEVPPFGGPRVVVYDDDDPGEALTERRPRPGEVSTLPDGDLHGYRIIEDHLDELLDRAAAEADGTFG